MKLDSIQHHKKKTFIPPKKAFWVLWWRESVFSSNSRELENSNYVNGTQKNTRTTENGYCNGFLLPRTWTRRQQDKLCSVCKRSWLAKLLTGTKKNLSTPNICYGHVHSIKVTLSLIFVVGRGGQNIVEAEWSDGEWNHCIFWIILEYFPYLLYSAATSVTQIVAKYAWRFGRSLSE